MAGHRQAPLYAMMPLGDMREDILPMSGVQYAGLSPNKPEQLRKLAPVTRW